MFHIENHFLAMKYNASTSSCGDVPHEHGTYAAVAPALSQLGGHSGSMVVAAAADDVRGMFEHRASHRAVSHHAVARKERQGGSLTSLVVFPISQRSQQAHNVVNSGILLLNHHVLKRAFDKIGCFMESGGGIETT